MNKKDLSPKEEESRKSILEEAPILMLEMMFSGINLNDLELDHEDKILFAKFQDPDYVHDDPHYFEKGLRVIRRVRKLFDEYISKLWNLKSIPAFNQVAQKVILCL